VITQEDCDGCQGPLGDTWDVFDPGHDYGCAMRFRRGVSNDLECHARYCSERCYLDTCERGAQREYERFHQG